VGVGECGEQPGGDARGDQGVPVGGCVDGLRQQGRAGVFEQKAPGTSLQRAAHVLVEIERGDHDHRQRVLDAGAGELAGGFDPVDLGHADVEQAHVWAQCAGQRHCFPTVGGFADDLDAGLDVEDHGQSGTDDVLVVGDEHADRHVVAPLLGRTASTVQPPSGRGRP